MYSEIHYKQYIFIENRKITVSCYGSDELTELLHIVKNCNHLLIADGGISHIKFNESLSLAEFKLITDIW